MRTKLLSGVVVLLLATGGVQIASLHRVNAQLRTQLNERRLRDENRTAGARTPMPSSPAGIGSKEPWAATPNEASDRLTRLRVEVAAAEKRAAEEYASTLDAIEETSTNRDPEKGMTRLEYLQNLGRGTPAAALQTLFWAVLRGEEQVSTQTIGWEETVRPQAQALLDGLPKELRARFPTPEQLAALFISKYVLDVSAIHISETTLKDASSASVAVEGLTGDAQPLPMHLGPGGWQLWAGQGTLEALSKELLGKGVSSIDPNAAPAGKVSP